MISKIFFLLLIIFLSLIGFAAYQNPQTVDFKVFQGTSFTTPLSALVLFAFCLGALIVLCVMIIRDIRRAAHLRKERKAQKREMEKIADYTITLEELLWGDLADVGTRLEKMKKSFKEDTRLLRVRLAFYKRLEEWRAAYQIVSQLRAHTDSPDTGLLMDEATLADKADLPDKALAVFKEILGQKRDYLPALEGIRDILEREEKWEEAINFQARIVKASGKNAKEAAQEDLFRLRYRLAKKLLSDSETNAEAQETGIKLIRSLMKKAPENNALPILLGRYYQRKGRGKEAVKVWETAFSKTGNTYFLYLTESALREDERLDEMLKRYGKAYRATPENLETAFLYARFCLKTEKTDEAEKVLASLPNKAEEHPAFGLLKADLLIRQKKEKEAFGACRHAIEQEKLTEMPFVCGACGNRETQWQDICPACGAIGTLRVVFS